MGIDELMGRLGAQAAHAQTAPAPAGATPKGAPPTAEQVLATPFTFKGGTVDYAEKITTALAVLIPVLILLAHILQRRRAWTMTVNVLRFAGIFLLPVFMWLIGSYATFEGAAKVEFCHSCHSAMDMYVLDMRDPASTNLAAVHYKNRLIDQEQCYTCHADYGVFGTMDAKMTGLIHLYRWLTSSPTALGEKQIELYHPYQNTWCLHCHAGSKRFLEAAGGTHTGLADQLLTVDPKTQAPGMSCLECHGPVHPTVAQWKARGAKK
jgi:cytochrome c-type protein NapC